MPTLQSGLSTSERLETGSSLTVTPLGSATVALTATNVAGGAVQQTQSATSAVVTVGPFDQTVNVNMVAAAGQVSYSVIQSVASDMFTITTTATLISSPTPQMLADTVNVYVVPGSPPLRYQSNGSAMVAAGSGGGGTPADGSITNAKLAVAPTKTYKGNTTGGSAAPTDIDLATMRADLALVADDLTASTTVAPSKTAVNTGLAAKADSLAQSLLVSGATLTRATHLNRPLIINDAGASTLAFTNAAGSGAVAGDSIYIRNTGAGTFTATGAISGVLTAPPGVAFSADYDSIDDTWVSTTPSAAASGTQTVKTINAQFPNYAAGATPSLKCIAVIPIPALGTATRVDFDLRLSATTPSATGKSVLFYLSATADAVGNAGAPVGTSLQNNANTWTASNAFARIYSSFQNMGSQSAQSGPADSFITFVGQGPTAPRTATINTAVPTYMNIYLTAAGTDLVTLNSVVTVAYDPAGL